MRLVDTHCHLESPQFEEDREEVVHRARQAGLERILTIGTDLATSRMAVDLTRHYPEVYAAVGVHPHDAAGFSPETLDELRRLASDPKVVAIGEIGLDFYRDWSPRDRQAEAFRAQLELAAELRRPVIIHDREAHEAILSELSAWVERLGHEPAARELGVLHSFSGDPALASRAVDLGFYIGITGPVTFRKKAEILQSVAAGVSLERVLIETDAPYLTPHPYRGRRNEPAYVVRVAEAIAALRGLPVEHIATQTTANAARLFGWI